MIDLLMLANIGHNMELYTIQSLHNNISRLHHHHQRHNQAKNVSTSKSQNPDQGCLNKRLRDPQSQAQCRPLDLSVKRAETARHSSNKIRQIKRFEQQQQQHRNQKSIDNLLLTTAIKHQQLQTKASYAKQLQSPVSSVVPTPTLSTANVSGNIQQKGTKQISSSTSPSSCASTNLHSPIDIAVEQVNTSSSCPPEVSLISSTNGRRQKHKGLKSHLCHQCGRSFSRSDMLTRHSRLHSGLKPYQCSKCKQVFSRSDHLSTHERTHTGEKPYQCQHCAYSACRRDMITRHMRTHGGGQAGQRTSGKNVSNKIQKQHDHLQLRSSSIEGTGVSGLGLNCCPDDEGMSTTTTSSLDGELDGQMFVEEDAS